MKIITTTGFYGTGSSAITDLLKEYDNVSCKSDYELRFLFDPECVSDLEFNLIENPNRHNSSHSLKRFIKSMKNLDHIWFVKRYCRYFNGKFYPVVSKYISKLVELEYYGAWHYDVYDKGKIFYICSRLYSKINVLLHKVIKIPINGRTLIPKNEKAYLTIKNQNVFLKATKEFVDDVASLLNVENKEFIILDQLVPPSNIKRYSRYVNDLKVIVVDRDPRDIYILEKEVWKGCVAPSYDPQIFCEWFKWTRSTFDSNCQNVLRIQFEDLVYNYYETVKKIETFLEIDSNHHKKLLETFNPNISKKNTKLWEIYSLYQNEVEIIENELRSYCYKFPITNEKRLEKKHELF